jgi:3',5'-cyclic AMP phosphodiesterase CpdA
LRALLVALIALLAGASPAQADGCTIAAIADTQYLATDSTLPAEIIDYILAERETWKPGYPIAFVSHVGDVVNRASQAGRWDRMQTELRRLNGIIPWSVVAGNHDADDWHGDPMGFPEYMERFNDLEYATAYGERRGSLYLGSWGRRYANNNHSLFRCGSRTVHHMGISYQHEHPANADVLPTAKALRAQFSRVPLIVTSHSILQQFCSDNGPEGTRFTADGGHELWEDFLSDEGRLVLSMAGHATKVCHYPDAPLTSHGTQPRHYMYNLQDEGTYPNAGEGWIAFYTIDWNSSTIEHDGYTTFRDVKASEDGRNPFGGWYGTQGFTILPEPRADVGMICGVLALLVFTRRARR